MNRFEEIIDYIIQLETDNEDDTINVSKEFKEEVFSELYKKEFNKRFYKI